MLKPKLTFEYSFKVSVDIHVFVSYYTSITLEHLFNYSLMANVEGKHE